jgi:hypothetical protein
MGWQGVIAKVHNSDISSVLFVCHLADSWKVDKYRDSSRCLKEIHSAIHMLRPGTVVDRPTAGMYAKGPI